MDNSELYHHGIKGQKWGVRRFQNKDGSLTPAGKERYYVDNDASTVISKNSDGSYTVPAGFKFNRVGQKKHWMLINQVYYMLAMVRLMLQCMLNH